MPKIGAMQKINAYDIKEGDCFAQPLFTASGQKLLNAGVAISAFHLRVLHNLNDPELYLGGETGSRSGFGGAGGRTANGSVLRRSRPRGIGVGGGSLSAAHVAGLSPQDAGGAAPVGADAASRHRHALVVDSETIAANLMRSAARMDLRIPVSARDLWGSRPASIDPDKPAITELVRMRMQMVESVRGWQSQLESGQETPPGPLQQVIRDLFALLMEYPERFTQIALLCPRRDNYIPDHSLCVAALAMATAARMNWSAIHVQKAGLCALLADVGMMLVPERIRTAGAALTEADRQIVNRHPAYTAAMLRHVPTLEPVLRLAAYQHHERENGLGYPAGVRSEQICDYAKVLAVCDVFAAATGPRAYHPGKLPYVVMEELIRAAAGGIFDRAATRALVRAAGLFPVGSYVLLSTQQLAVVLSCNPDRLDRPVVRLHDTQGQLTEQILDLAAIPPEELRVLRPAHPPGWGQ